jgi:hypothetical protein
MRPAIALAPATAAATAHGPAIPYLGAAARNGRRLAGVPA